MDTIDIKSKEERDAEMNELHYIYAEAVKAWREAMDAHTAAYQRFLESQDRSAEEVAKAEEWLDSTLYMTKRMRAMLDDSVLLLNGQAARLDYISAALAVGKSDHEIKSVMSSSLNLDRRASLTYWRQQAASLHVTSEPFALL